MTLKQYHDSLQKSLERLIDPSRKNIVFLSYDPRLEPFSALPNVLSQHYNVIIAGNTNTNDSYAGLPFVSIPFKIFDEHTKSFHITPIHVDGIDLIITADVFDEQQLNKEFLSKKAKRLYIPPSIFSPAHIDYTAMDYIAVPSRLALPLFEEYAPTAKMLQSGSPYFDSLVTLFEENLPSTDLYYASELQYAHLSPKEINIYAGYENMLLEWLLTKTEVPICYMPNIMNVLNNHPCYIQIKKKWQAHKRISFIEKVDSILFAKASCLVSFASLFACHFAIASLRPTLIFMPARNQKEWEQHHLFSHIIVNNLFELADKLHQNIQPHEQYLAFREDNLYNIKQSINYLADNVDLILRA